MPGHDRLGAGEAAVCERVDRQDRFHAAGHRVELEPDRVLPGERHGRQREQVMGGLRLPQLAVDGDHRCGKHRMLCLQTVGHPFGEGAEWSRVAQSRAITSVSIRGTDSTRGPVSPLAIPFNRMLASASPGAAGTTVAPLPVALAATVPLSTAPLPTAAAVAAPPVTIPVTGTKPRSPP